MSACTATTKAGAACKAQPMKNRDTCHAHTVSLGDARFGSPAQAREAGKLGGRPPLPKPTDVARKLIEENVTAILRPHFLALGLELHADGTTTRLDGGALLYGESKDGEIVASSFEDLAAQMEAAEKLLNRVYGRPKTTTEISGLDGGPVATALVLDPTLAEEGLDLLARAARASSE